MRSKFLFVAAIALLGTLGLSACNQNKSEAPTEQAKATKPTAADVDNAIKECQAKNPARPAAPAAGQTAAPAPGQSAAAAGDQGATEDDTCARATVAFAVWRPYLQDIVTANMGDVTNSPYIYFVPSSKYPENQGAIGRVQGQINDSVAATVLPGNMVAAAGPDSATTAQVLETAFKSAAKGSFKGVVVLFIGDKADESAVQAAVEPSGATFKFAQM